MKNVPDREKEDIKLYMQYDADSLKVLKITAKVLEDKVKIWTKMLPVFYTKQVSYLE